MVINMIIIMTMLMTILLNNTTTIMLIITALRPLPEAVRFESLNDIDLTPSPGAKWAGGAVVITVGLLYLIYR